MAELNRAPTSTQSAHLSAIPHLDTLYCRLKPIYGVYFLGFDVDQGSGVMPLGHTHALL